MDDRPILFSLSGLIFFVVMRVFTRTPLLRYSRTVYSTVAADSRVILEILFVAHIDQEFVLWFITGHLTLS